MIFSALLFAFLVHSPTAHAAGPQPIKPADHSTPSTSTINSNSASTSGQSPAADNPLPATSSVNPQSPATFCDRFLGEVEKGNCEKRVKIMAPDWYLAKVCEKQFDDENFWNCLELSHQFNFNPKTLGLCEDTGMTDTQRLLCIEEKALRKNASIMDAYQRMPASDAKAKKKKLH